MINRGYPDGERYAGDPRAARHTVTDPMSGYLTPNTVDGAVGLYQSDGNEARKKVYGFGNQ